MSGPPPDSDWAPLFDLDDPVDAAAAQSILVEAGVEAEVVAVPFPGRPSRRELWVRRGEAERAMRLVGEFAVPEAKPAPRPDPPAAPHGAAAAVHLTGVFALSWLALFAPVLDAGRDAALWRLMRLGAVQPERVFAGEWWRLVAAQFLHHDIPHILGNLTFLILLCPSFARRFGAGRAAFIALLAGAGGFFASALALSPRGSSVGASATIFGILGALAMDRIVHAWGGPWPGKSLLKLGGAALALALFRDESTDVAAHAGALLCGALLAVIVRPPGASPGLRARALSIGLGLLALGGAAWAISRGVSALLV